MNGRSSGILLPISSLPGPYGIGNLGRAAYEFIDYLTANEQAYWQILPLGPTSIGDSPYQSFSTYAGNPYLIDLAPLIEAGLLTPQEVALPEHDAERIDYGLIYQTRIDRLKLAYQRCDDKMMSAVLAFAAEEDWLEDYALFMTMKDLHDGAAWYVWPEADKFRHDERLHEIKANHQTELYFWYFVQYLFFSQWHALRTYAEDNGIEIIGDIPLYVAQDSVDVWTSPELFLLDEDRLPIAVAGYPPDDFSSAGQLWGNPLFDWSKMKQDDYLWWQHRLVHQMRLYHIVRLDHFIGFHRFWMIPYGDSDATRGKWQYGPGSDFFLTVLQARPELHLIAEDLGIVTKAVTAMRQAAGLPSMRVLMFGFDPTGDSENAPHHYTLDTIAYTGTHDNDTVIGWWQKLSPEQQAYVRDYLDFDGDEIVDAMLRTLYRSGARITLTTMQDLLGQDNAARINEPNTMGNWTYRLPPDYLERLEPNYLANLTKTYRRHPNELIQ